jgi:hypothetical protein
MSAQFQIQVFGKEGCDKCTVLNRRIDSTLQKDKWKDFEKLYLDVETEDGIVAFARAECINPQRIPAFLVTRYNVSSGHYEPIPYNGHEELDSPTRKTRLYSYLGCQTDYSPDNNGVINPKSIKKVMEEAVNQ